MGKALYRQYRSSSFDEVIGQDHITKTLEQSLKSGSIAHAYLLTGPRGVGKTSVARILAFAVNEIDYDIDTTHIDVIEIDAASNRRIDEIRSLRERAQIAPTMSKYKVYIIDEVHMLTREAFNALLKTLEEPPAHVIFILATTELNKLPDTIISRCITFTFRPIQSELLVSHMKKIASAEKLSIDDEALALLATHGEGSFRDSISLLEQVRHLGKRIEANDIEMMLGIAPSRLINELLLAVQKGEPKKLADLLEEAYAVGANELKLSKQLAAEIRNRLISGSLDMPKYEATQMLKNLLEVPSASNSRAILELSLLDQLFKRVGDKDSPSPVVVKETKPVEETITLDAEVILQPVGGSNKSNEKVVEAQKDIWNDILHKLKEQNNTLYGVARMAQADLQDNNLALSFQFPFHFKQVNNPKNKSLITLILSELGHHNLSLDIKLVPNKGTQPKTLSSKNKSDSDANLQNITNIFGKGEMLES